MTGYQNKNIFHFPIHLVLLLRAIKIYFIKITSNKFDSLTNKKFDGKLIYINNTSVKFWNNLDIRNKEISTIRYTFLIGNQFSKICKIRNFITVTINESHPLKKKKFDPLDG